MNHGLATGVKLVTRESGLLPMLGLGESVDFRHGLTGFVVVQPVLLCVVANNGYLPGDEIPLEYPYVRNGTNTGEPFISWVARPGVVTLTRNSAAAGDLWKQTANGFDLTFTTANWKIKVRVHV